MVRADQGIRGRSAPRAKSRSSVTASIRSRTSASAPSATAADPPTQITKAAKRALKRADLMSKVDPTAKRTSLLNLEPTVGLSKSSLRRQKRKQKEQLAGNTTGLKDLAEAMDEVAHQVQVEDDEDDDEENVNDLEDEDEDDDMLAKAARGGSQPSSAYPLVGAHKSRKDATVTERARKQALSLERQRQNLILSDPAYSKNPFAALRLHAQNTLAFDKGKSASKH